LYSLIVLRDIVLILFLYNAMTR